MEGEGVLYQKRQWERWVASGKSNILLCSLQCLEVLDLSLSSKDLLDSAWNPRDQANMEVSKHPGVTKQPKPS